MDFINNIKEETLIICNKYIKEDILKINKLLPIKLINLNEFKEKYFFLFFFFFIFFIIFNYKLKYLSKLDSELAKYTTGMGLEILIQCIEYILAFIIIRNH